MNGNGTHLVFVYGILKSEEHAANPPHAARGTMYAGPFACCKFGAEHSDGIVRGEILEVDDGTLRRFDVIEGVNHADPDRGLYKRIEIETTCGVRCWVYEYAGDVDCYDVIEDGVWTRDGNRARNW